MAALSINITLFVQVINFFVAYGILRYLFLDTAIDIILHERNNMRLLKADIMHYENRIVEEDAYNKNLQKSFTLYTRENTPEMINYHKMRLNAVKIQRVCAVDNSTKPAVTSTDMDRYASWLASDLCARIIHKGAGTP